MSTILRTSKEIKSKLGVQKKERYPQIKYNPQNKHLHEQHGNPERHR
jgi:hypothetical protein